MRDFSDLIRKMDILYPLLAKVGDSELIAVYKFQADRIENPESFVTFLGETSGGKSTLINGLIGKPLLPMRASPTTGAITEIIFNSECQEDSFFSVTKNAALKMLDKKTALHLIEHPDDDIARLRICTKSCFDSAANMRIFDTPGYDSIISEHEEILKEFIPNSDVVVYTVGYKIGIQENDYAFLRFLKELIRDDADVIVAVNRCPEDVDNNDPRIKEIMKYASDILLEEPPCVLITKVSEEGVDHPIPDVREVWDVLESIVNSNKRIDALHDTFNTYIEELYGRASDIIQHRYATALLDKQEMENVDKEQKASAERIRHAVGLYVKPGFDKIIDLIPKRMKKAAENAEKEVIQEIDAAPTGKMDEMLEYTNAHLIPFYTKQESKEVQSYIELYLNEINKNVDDYLNKEIINFNTKVSVILSTHTEIAVRNIGTKAAHRVGYQSLLGYFTQFGGAGGANAGIANAASHVLKQVGDVFGKTFSRETHNALKHTLARIGATSMKAVGAALTVIIELAAVTLDYATWKMKLKPKVNKALENWENETTPTIISDLYKLRDENVKTIYQIADSIEHTFDTELYETDDTKTIELLLDMCETIGKKIGVNV